MLFTLPQLIAKYTADVRCIDAESATAEIAKNQGILIDLREPGEVAVKAATGTINIPRGVLEMKISDLASSPATPIYLHCAGGGRARLAAEQLMRMGYENATAIGCGIDRVCEIFNDA